MTSEFRGADNYQAYNHDAAKEPLGIVQMLDMWNPDHRLFAARKVADIYPISILAIQFGVVFAASEEATSWRILSQVKGGERRNPVPIWVRHPKEITDAQIVDFSRVHPDFHALLHQPSELALRMQGISMLKLPVRPDSYLNGVKLHPAILDTTDSEGSWLLFLYMGDNQPASQRLIEEIYNQRVSIVGISSLNLHKKESPKDSEESIQFCRSIGIDVLIADSLSKLTQRKLSYPILKITKKGLELWRPGNVPVDYLQAIWTGFPFSDTAPREIQGTSAEDIERFLLVMQQCPQMANVAIRIIADQSLPEY